MTAAPTWRVSDPRHDHPRPVRIIVVANMEADGDWIMVWCEATEKHILVDAAAATSNEEVIYRAISDKVDLEIMAADESHS